MTIKKRKTKNFNKVDEFLKNRNKNDSSENSSAPSHNQSTINMQMNNITTKQHIPLNISIPPTKSKTRINYKQDSQTTTSSRYSHDSNWRTSQPNTIQNLRSPTQIEINSNLINQQYSKQISTYLNDRKKKNYHTK